MNCWGFLFSVKQSLFWHVYKYVVNDIKMYLGVKCLLRKKTKGKLFIKKENKGKKPKFGRLVSASLCCLFSFVLKILAPGACVYVRHSACPYGGGRTLGK